MKKFFSRKVAASCARVLTLMGIACTFAACYGVYHPEWEPEDPWKYEYGTPNDTTPQKVAAEENTPINEVQE